MKVAFITGITGQDGSYLSEFLLEKGYKVYGIVRRNSMLYTYSRIEKIRDNLNLMYGDLTDSLSISSILSKILEDNGVENIEVFEIYNLGAQSHVKVSFEVPKYTTDVDAMGCLNILDIVKAFPKKVRDKIRLYQAGTSEMYGKVLETPQSETTPFNPMSPYGCAKVYSHYMIKIYRDGYNLHASNGILFNHESSRRGKNFVTMKVIDGVKKILKDDNYVLKLGNLNSYRDWGHAKDYIKGMWLILQQEKPDDYVLATGEKYSVRNFVERTLEKVGIEYEWEGKDIDEVCRDRKSGRIIIKIDEEFFRPCEVDLLLGDSTKARNVLGWNPEFNLDGIIDEMLKNSD